MNNSTVNRFTIVTPSEVHQSTNFSKIIKHKSGKVFRWHQDKLHTTLESTCSNPVKFSLSPSPLITSKSSSNVLLARDNSHSEQLSPSLSSHSSSSSTSSRNITSQLVGSQSNLCAHQYNHDEQNKMNGSSHATTKGISKQYKARNNFKFFDYTMKKRKRTRRCDQVQPYENVISFTVDGVQSSNMSEESVSDERMETTLHEITQCIQLGDSPLSGQMVNSVSTAPLLQPKTYRTSILTIKELLN